jgi:hyaluronan synthase
MYLLAFLLFAIPGFLIALRLVAAIVPEGALSKGKQVRKDPNFTPSVAVVIPCYNEGEVVYDAIKHVWESDYPKDKLAIYVQDDFSVDDSWTWIQKAATDFDRVYPERNPVNSGKTISYLRGMDRSESDIVLIVDSDTLVNPLTVRKIAACFADERLGVVGAPLGTANPGKNLLTAIQTYLYLFGLRIAKISESHFQGVAVIGGFALAVRRHLLQELKQEILDRNWFGVPVKDGEDRFITHLALLRGWGTYVEQGAAVNAYALETYAKYFGQQLRWKRSLLRTFMWLVRTLPMQVEKMNGVALMAVFSSGLVALILFMGIVFVATMQPMIFLNPVKVLPWFIVSSIAMMLCSWKLKDQFVHPARLVLFAAWWIVNLFYLVILSLFTLDQDAWGSREKTVKPVEEQQ